MLLVTTNQVVLLVTTNQVVPHARMPLTRQQTYGIFAIVILLVGVVCFNLWGAFDSHRLASQRRGTRQWMRKLANGQQTATERRTKHTPNETESSELEELRVKLHTAETELKQARNMVSTLQKALVNVPAGVTPGTVGPEQSQLFAFIKQYFRNTEPPAATDGPWLTIGIPSRPRSDTRKQKMILENVFESLREKQAAPDLFTRMSILVVNNSPLHGAHPALDEVLKRGKEAYPHVHLKDNPFLQTMLDLGHGWKHNSTVGARVKHHLLDVLSTLMVAYRFSPISSLYMFHEDDFVACPGATHAVRRSIADANARFAACTGRTAKSHHNGLKSWRGIRLTFGMAGIVIPAAAIPSVAFYLLQAVERVPVDHALVEWILGAGEAPWQHDVCPYFVVRENMFEHLGNEFSTFQGRKHRQQMSCRENMTRIGIFRKGEAFDEQECPHDRMYPCASSIFHRRQENPDSYDALPLLEITAMFGGGVKWEEDQAMVERDRKSVV